MVINSNIKPNVNKKYPMAFGQKTVYVSTSFHEPATEGLRFIYSKDGYHWDSIPGTWLAPQVGTQKVMRDPSLTQSPDGTFHLVWTSSWRGDLGFGYSKSKDLIHWSKEQFIPVMKDEPTTVNVWAPEIFYDDTKGWYRDWETDRKSTRLNSSHRSLSRMPSSA